MVAASQHRTKTATGRGWRVRLAAPSPLAPSRLGMALILLGLALTIRGERARS
jgi:hypothetical protein